MPGVSIAPHGRNLCMGNRPRPLSGRKEGVAASPQGVCVEQVFLAQVSLGQLG